MASADTDNEVFQKIDWERFPSLIAHEVLRSHNYLLENKYFLAIYQIKDMYEVTIKLISLMVIAKYESQYHEMHGIHHDHWFAKYCEIRSENQTGLSKQKLKKYFQTVCHISDDKELVLQENQLDQYSFDNLIEYCRYRQILNLLLEKSLSLGDWVKTILQGISKLKLLPESFRIVSEKLFLTINREGSTSFDLTAWRNNDIGHGALQSELSDRDIENIQKKMALLISFFYDQREFFYAMDLTLETTKSDFILLNGKSLAVNLPEGDYSVLLKFNDSGEEIQINPLIKISDKGIYIFDSFLPYKIDSFSIDYPNGRRNKSHPELKAWLTNIRTQIGITTESLYSSIHNTVFEKEINALLDNLSKAKDFFEPQYLKKKVIDFLENNDNGLYLIYLDRGMGKSYFAKGLNQLDETKNIFEAEDTDWIIRTIHLNTYTLYNRKLFTQALPEAIMPGGRTRDFFLEYTSSSDTEQKRQQIAKYL